MHNTKNLLIQIYKINSRSFSKCCIRNVAAENTQTTPSNEMLSIPVPEGINQPPNPKLLNIVNEISTLNLLEVSELSKLLKKTLNLPDAPMMMGSFGGNFATNKVAAEDEEEVAPKKVQTSFKVKLMKFDEKQKVPLIKEIKNLLEGMNLVQAKKFVESAPTTVKEDVTKDESAKLKEALEKVGATIEIE